MGEVTFVEEYRTVDKSTWGDGPWQDEPDKAVWVDEATDLDCMIVRNNAGALCGYVGVGPDHPLHGKGYDDVNDPYPDVHGGLTYANACQGSDDLSRFICHRTQPGRPDPVWWFGFDCAHSMDVCPGMDARLREIGHEPMRYSGDGWRDTYRDVPYVIGQVTSLAAQLSATP